MQAVFGPLHLSVQVQTAIGEAGGAEEVGKRGGVFIRDDATLDDGDRTLLKSAARIAANGSVAGPAGSSRRPTRLLRHAERAALRATFQDGPPRRAPGLVADNGHGGFTPDLREYVIIASVTHMTPAPWTT